MLVLSGISGKLVTPIQKVWQHETGHTWMARLKTYTFCSLKNCKPKPIAREKDTKEWGGAQRIWDIRGINKSGFPQNYDYFTKKKPTGQWHQRDLYSVGKLKTVSLTWSQPPRMLMEAPGVTSLPREQRRADNLSWCSSCQPRCFDAAVCHPGGWDLLKGNHVNLYVTTQSKAERWWWQAWQSQQKVPKAEVIVFPQRCHVGMVFFVQFFLYVCFPFLLKSSWHGLRHTELAFRAGHLG